MDMINKRLSILPSINGLAFLHKHLQGLQVINLGLINFNFLLLTELTEVDDHEGLGHVHLHWSLD